jgi:hypothetical protein
MNQLRKAQLTIGLLACFAMAWGLVQQALNAQDQLFALGIVMLQLIAIIILAIIIINLLEWVDIFDLKTNAILTLIVLVTIRIYYDIALILETVTPA